MSLPKLYVLHVSPWSERARWALDHHGLEYQTVQHAPFLGEGRLRKLVGRAEGPVTVPVLVHRDTVLTQSWDIALYADRNGDGTALIPGEREAEIREWVQRIDAASSRGRAIVLAKMLRSPAALDESHPPAVPTWIRPMLRPVTRYGTRWFGRKYGLQLDELDANEQKMREVLSSVRAGLGESQYLLGTFTYADIVAASMLQGITPVADEYIRLGPATREVWTQPELAREFADLLRWRDALYRMHRRRREQSPAPARAS
jgi:glutathione S-transferase